MGYTHYWTQTRNLTTTDMIDVAESFRKIEKASGVKILGWDGSGKPEVNARTIGFNGAGDDGHETFRIHAKRELPFEGATRERLGWAFCKTAYKPYDIVVTALLTVLAAKYGFDVSSDGGPDDWDKGVKLASKALGEVFRNPIRKEAA